MILSALAGLLLQPATSDASRAEEGDWYVVDQTDNNTGAREVYAMQLHLKRDDPDYVTVTMRCSEGQSLLFIDWNDLPFPDQAVITIGPVANPDAEPAEQNYVFEKSKEVTESGMKATAETSAKIIAAVGQSKYATVTAHLSSGTRTVGIDVNGTQRAWSRVTRHCPVQRMAQPPL